MQNLMPGFKRLAAVNVGGPLPYSLIGLVIETFSQAAALK